MKSFRKILPKIVLPTVQEEAVDPQPAVLVSQEELTGIEISVQEALMSARTRHAAGVWLTEPSNVLNLQLLQNFESTTHNQ